MADPVFERNKIHARPGSYDTSLSPEEERQFQKWLLAEKVPYDPSEKVQDYDMRGFFKGLLTGDKAAVSAIDPYDKRMHFPDIWKTPYHETFSNESKYALPTAPKWSNDGRFLSTQDGKILFDAAQKR